MLEYFVHLDKDDPPDDLVLAVAEVPDNLRHEKVELAALPVKWCDSAAPPELARWGDDFAQRNEYCLLFVPSVLAPNENNCLINPVHPDYGKLVMHDLESLNYDPRMFRKQPQRHR
jgi:RES domain-containing protein